MNIISNNDKKETCILREREKIKTETRQGTLNIHSMVRFKKRKTGFLETAPQKRFSLHWEKKEAKLFFLLLYSPKAIISNSYICPLLYTFFSLSNFCRLDKFFLLLCIFFCPSIIRLSSKSSMSSLSSCSSSSYNSRSSTFTGLIPPHPAHSFAGFEL